MWELSSAMINSLHNSIPLPEMEINLPKMASGCPCGCAKNKNKTNKKTVSQAILSSCENICQCSISYMYTGWPPAVFRGEPLQKQPSKSVRKPPDHVTLDNWLVWNPPFKEVSLQIFSLSLSLSLSLSVSLSLCLSLFLSLSHPQRAYYGWKSSPHNYSAHNNILMWHWCSCWCQCVVTQPKQSRIAASVYNIPPDYDTAQTKADKCI